MSKVIRMLARVAVTGVVVVAVALVLAAAGVVGSGAPAKSRAQTEPALATVRRPTLSTVATATVPALQVFAAPGSKRATHTLANPRESGAPLVLLVTSERDGWFEVQVPERPNGSTGWVRNSDVTTEQHTFRIEVSLSKHRLSAYDGDRQLLDTVAAVGQSESPTPTGSFYTTELLQPANQSGPYGPYAFGLSAHSDVLTDFAGGDGTVGIHGTNQPSLLGTDASHGCIRISNEAIALLAERVPVGTPVVIAP